jgi:hypothetical protein
MSVGSVVICESNHGQLFYSCLARPLPPGPPQRNWSRGKVLKHQVPPSPVMSIRHQYSREEASHAYSVYQTAIQRIGEDSSAIVNFLHYFQFPDNNERFLLSLLPLILSESLQADAWHQPCQSSSYGYHVPRQDSSSLFQHTPVMPLCLRLK